MESAEGEHMADDMGVTGAEEFREVCFAGIGSGVLVEDEDVTPRNWG